MKFFLSTIVAVAVFTSCAQTQSGNKKDDLKIFPGTQQKFKNEAVASFAEGCFWHTEIVFQSLEGVRDAVSGYSGGTDTNPDYEKVSSGRTGHAETVNVYYDPSIVSFQTLVKAFFASHNPAQLNRQGNDEGTQYRSVAFYRNEEEKKIIEDEIKQLKDAKKYSGKIVTEVKPFIKFYPAEEYHQEYIYHHPGNPYVQNVSLRDFSAFKKIFKDGKFKS